MNILVTAGGTSEAIDEVRAITNTSTGELGVLIAKNFLNMGANVVLMAPNSVQKKINDYRQLTRCEVTDVLSVEEALRDLMTEYQFDAVIHAMAISDYRVRQILDETDTVVTAGKISSDNEQLTIQLEKAPKIIRKIKEYQPQTCLVGFKLLVGATKEELLAAAHCQQQAAGSDFVLANDLDTIHHNEHVGYLIKENDIVVTYHTKQEIAFGVMTEVLTQVSCHE